MSHTSRKETLTFITSLHTTPSSAERSTSALSTPSRAFSGISHEPMSLLVKLQGQHTDEFRTGAFQLSENRSHLFLIQPCYCSSDDKVGNGMYCKFSQFSCSRMRTEHYETQKKCDEPLKYNSQRRSKTGAGERETSVSRRRDEAGSRRSVATKSDDSGFLSVASTKKYHC